MEKKSLKTRFTLPLNSVFASKKIKPFLITMLFFGMGIGFVAGILNNYLHDILNITKTGRGLVEFPRELPGLLLILIIALLHRFSEIKMLRIGFMIGIAGIAGMALTGTSIAPALLFLVLWSTSEHMMMPLRDSVAMHMASEGNSGTAIGIVASFRNIGQVTGFYLIPLIFFLLPQKQESGGHSWSDYRIIMILAGIALLVSLILSFRLKETKSSVKRQRLYFHKKYTKYYLLETFFGARKQVFLTFAPYVLIVHYGASAAHIAFLYGIWSLSNIFIAPLMGKILDRFGYRRIIIIDALMLIAICLLYGFAHFLPSKSGSFILVSVIFVIDAILFVVGMARSLYVRELSENREEITATLSTGISINHLISILIAMGGGLLWDKLGTEVLFSLAAVFGLGSFIFSLTLPKKSISKP